MKFRFLYLLLVFLVSCSISNNYSFLVGTYTETSSQGINFINFDTNTNKLSVISVIPDVKNPSFVITNKAKSIVVAVEEFKSETGGSVTSFTYNKSTNTFKKISSFPSFGDDPCTVAFSPDEKFIIVGNYSGGNYSVYPIDSQGKLSDKIQLINHIGKSVNKERQEKPHVHSVVFHPTENKLFIADLGNDTIEIVPFNQNETLVVKTEKSFAYQTIPGKGPRHMVFDKSGKYLFITFELTSEVGIAKYENDNLEVLQYISLTEIPTKSGSAAEVRLSADGNFLYASVRANDNVLVVMQRQDDESWKKIQTVSTGSAPRNFILTNDEKTILVANQKSNSIWVFNRNQKTGLLTKAQEEFSVHKPVYFCAF